MTAGESHDDQTRSFVALTKGTMVSHYRIVEKIGAGGMGEVYLAEDTELDRKGALKFLPSHLCQDEDCRKRFKREAQAAAKLDHPNIVPVYEVGEFKSRPFFAMAHIKGKSLQDVIREGKLSVSEAVNLTMQICEGLHKAHESGVIHRDIKPGNIIIDEENRPRIVDFGLASVSGDEKLTKTGSTLGTVGYMSPEQIEGKQVDHRSDLFSVGIILYEMLTGRQPFEGDNEAAIARAITDDTPEPAARFKSGVTTDLQQIINKALSKDPSLRYQHADGMFADLKRLRYESTTIKSGKKRWWITATAVLIVLVGYLAIDILIFDKDNNKDGWTDSVAVLIFRNLSSDSEQDYFCEGMTDEIIGRLATIKNLKVTSMQSILRFKDTGLDLKAIGRELKVNNILEGSIKQSGDSIRVRAQLIRVKDDAHIWTERYDREIINVFALQDDITRAIANALEATLVGTEEAFASRRGTENIDAYYAYVRGRYFWRRRTGEDILTSIDYFDKAVALDSGYAAAWSGLADAWWALPEYGNISESIAYPQWELAAFKAYELGPNLAEARATMANIHRMKGEFEDSEREYIEAIELNPGYSWSHYWYSRLLFLQGRDDERSTQLQLAYELDPLSLPVLANLANDNYRSGNYKKAIEYCQRAFEIGGGSGSLYWNLTFSYLHSGDTSLAFETVDRFINDQPGYWRSHDLKAQLLKQLGDYYKALEAYQKAIEVAPKRWEPQERLGYFMFEYLNRYEDAEKHLLKAIALDSLQASPHIRYAYLLDSMGRTSEAEKQYETFLDFWKNADEGLKFVEDAKDRLARLKDGL